MLRWREGDTVDAARAPTALDDARASIHWHGILLPANMDGVPGLSFNGIHPGETYHYRFDVRQSGTYWYHSHSAVPGTGRAVRRARHRSARATSRIVYDRDYVVLLSDWTDMDPAALFRA